jgi:glycosyltransferase involved in cell wall biosynthesis
MQDAQIICQQLPETHRSLRIAVVTETYPPEINGVALTIHRMIEGLRARDHEIQLVRPRRNGGDATAPDDPRFQQVLKGGVSIPGYSGLKMGLPAKQALTRLWSRQRPDIVHIVTEGPLGWSALAAAVKLRIPCCSDFHTNFHSYSRHYGIGWLHKPIAGYLRRFHNKAHRTFVPTTSLRENLEGHGYLNLRVVPRGVDTMLFNPARRSEALRRQWGVTGAQTVALCVGRLAAEKNLDAVVQAYGAMRAAEPGVRLVMVGDGPLRRDLQARHREVIFTGMQSGETLAEHFASADVFLFSSTTETYGNVTIEAMASGLAVVAYDYAAAAEHIRHGENGLLAAFDNNREFVNLAACLACDRPRTRLLGQAARKTAEQCDWNRVPAAFEAALRDVIDSCGKPVADDLRLSA